MYGDMSQYTIRRHDEIVQMVFVRLSCPVVKGFIPGPWRPPEILRKQTRSSRFGKNTIMILV